MNIMDLPIGAKCKDAGGEQYEVVSDKTERRPRLDRVTIRTTKRPDGTIAKFIRGIEVTPITQA